MTGHDPNKPRRPHQHKQNNFTATNQTLSSRVHKIMTILDHSLDREQAKPRGDKAQVIEIMIGLVNQIGFCMKLIPIGSEAVINNDQEGFMTCS